MVVTGLIILALVPLIRMEWISDTGDLRLIREELSHFARRVEELEKKDAEHAKENEELKARIKVLEATTQRQQDELDFLNNMLTQSTDNGQSTAKGHRNKTSIHGADQVTVQKTIAHNKRRSYQVNSIQRIRQVNTDTPVAFFSTLQHTISNSGSDQQIAFDHVITNIGNGFNKFSGDFRVPIKGIYVFSTTLSPYSTHNSHFKFMLNGTPVSNIYTLETASQQIVLSLNASDTVAVHTVNAGYHVQGGGYSTFSGFLLHQFHDGVAVVGK
ncbi:cerebellin 3 precursor [Mactra antiquata]